MKTSEFKPGLFLVTAANEAEAKSIAEKLVTERLAACVSLSPITSIFRWNDKIHCESEVQLVIKADLARSEEIITRVKALHSYEVPEIVAIPFSAGHSPYLRWIQEQVREGV